MRCSRRVCKRTLGLLTSVHERAVGTTRALAGATATVAALTLLGAALRFARLGAQGFWFDEGNTALLVHLSPGRMLGLIPQSESTPPLYYCVAWVWARVFGFAEAGLRSLSAVAGVITIPVTYATGRKLISRRVGVIVAGLTACSPLLIWYSQEARSYSLLVALSAVSLLALACALEQPTPLTLGCWVLASGLTLATHYYGVLVIVPEALWLLAARRRQRSVQVAVGLVALCGLALIPLALGQNATGNTNWIAPIPLGSRLGQVIPQFLVGFQTTAQSVLEPLAAALAVGALVLLALRSDAPALRRALALGAVAVGGLLLNLVLIAVGVDDLITRNLIALWVPVALVVAAGFGARWAGRLGVAGAVAMCAIGVTAAIGVATNRAFQRPDWRVVAHMLGSAPASGRVILIQHDRDLLPLSLYEHGLRFMGGSHAHVTELDVVAMGAPRVDLCWWGAACNLSPSTLQRSYPLRGFHQVWRRRELQFTVLGLRASRPVLVDRQIVSRALRRRRFGAMVS
ncbi:MAG: glycosyltransferase family 39 protein [Solirubrobacteraceae bacterium]